MRRLASVESAGESRFQQPQVKDHDSPLPLRAASFTVREGKIQRELCNTSLLAVTHDNFKDRSSTLSSTSPYTCARSTRCILGLQPSPGHTYPVRLFCALRVVSSVLITNDDDRVSAITMAIEANRRDSIVIDLFLPDQEEEPSPGDVDPQLPPNHRVSESTLNQPRIVLKGTAQFRRRPLRTVSSTDSPNTQTTPIVASC